MESLLHLITTLLCSFTTAGSCACVEERSETEKSCLSVVHAHTNVIATICLHPLSISVILAFHGGAFQRIQWPHYHCMVNCTADAELLTFCATNLR